MKIRINPSVSAIAAGLLLVGSAAVADQQSPLIGGVTGTVALEGTVQETIEGVVTNVDRHAKTMSIRLADGSRQTLQLTERAASDVGKDIEGGAVGTARVVVYFNDEMGRRVAHYFKRIS